MSRTVTPFRVFALTTLAMIAFAANSVLARLALGEASIGPWEFTAIRFVSGAVILALIAKPAAYRAGTWGSAIALLLYGSLFSFAYIRLTAGTGALILFAAVQITMIGGGLLAGEKLKALQWGGTIVAIAGLIYLLAPGITAPPFLAAIMMMGSGIGWGLYSLRGRKTGDPTAQTAGNFIRLAILCAVTSPIIFLILPETKFSQNGIILALSSGIITSALGYVIWYMALKGLTATRAGIAQLTVPVIAAIGGMIFIAEPLTWRFTLTALIILCGVAAATMTRQKS